MAGSLEGIGKLTQIRKFFGTLSFTPPVEAIKNYYGERIALYFALCLALWGTSGGGLVTASLPIG